MIAAREQEIRQFQPQPFYTVSALANGVPFVWTDKKSGSNRTFDKARAEQIRALADPADASFEILDVQKKTKTSTSPALYDLTALQQEANKRYGFSAKETLNIMQRLYETHKVLTYPRTDSRYLTTDMIGTLKERSSPALSVRTGSWRCLSQEQNSARRKHLSMIRKYPIITRSFRPSSLSRWNI